MSPNFSLNFVKLLLFASLVSGCASQKAMDFLPPDVRAFVATSPAPTADNISTGSIKPRPKKVPIPRKRKPKVEPQSDRSVKSERTQPANPQEVFKQSAALMKRDRTRKKPEGGVGQKIRLALLRASQQGSGRKQELRKPETKKPTKETRKQIVLNYSGAEVALAATGKRKLARAIDQAAELKQIRLVAGPAEGKNASRMLMTAVARVNDLRTLLPSNVEITQQFRRQQRKNSIRVVIVSGAGSNAMRQR